MNSVSTIQDNAFRSQMTLKSVQSEHNKKLGIISPVKRDNAGIPLHNSDPVLEAAAMLQKKRTMITKDQEIEEENYDDDEFD